jgi:hypothetical protein
VALTATAAAAGQTSAQEDDDDEDETLPQPPAQRLAEFSGNVSQWLLSRISDIDPWTGVNVDEQSYKNLEAQEVHTEIYKDAKGMFVFDESVLTNADNLLNYAPNALYADAKFAAIEVNKRGGSLNEAKQAAEEKINSLLVKTQKNILDQWSAQVAKVEQMSKDIDSVEGLEQYGVFDFKRTDFEDDDGGGFLEIIEIETKEIELLNGLTFDHFVPRIKYAQPDNAGDGQLRLRPNSADSGAVVVEPVETGEATPVLSVDKYEQVWSRVVNTAESTKEEVTQLIDGVWSKLNKEQYGGEDLISGSDLVGLASDNPETYSAAAADLIALNVPLSDPSLMVRLPEENDGDGVKYEGTLAITAGKDVTLEVGKRYSPESLPGKVILVFNKKVDGKLRGKKRLLTEPFVISRAVDPETDEEVESVTFSGRTQQRTDIDVEGYIEDLRRLGDQQREIEERQREIVVGGSLFEDVGSAVGDAAFQLALILGGLYVVIRGLGDSG